MRRRRRERKLISTESTSMGTDEEEHWQLFVLGDEQEGGNRCMLGFFQNNNNSSCSVSIVRRTETCSWKVAVCYFKVCLSPWLRDLLLGNRCPRRLAVPLLFEFATERLFYVVHVEGTDRRAGDAGEEVTERGGVTQSGTKVRGSASGPRSAQTAPCAQNYLCYLFI